MSQCRRREARAGNHVLDGPDPGNRLFRERKSERYGAEQFTVDIHGTAAHALQYTGFGERAATQARENDRLFWIDILQDSEDLDLELIDMASLEDGAANAAEAWVNFFEGEEPLPGCRDRGSECQAEHREEHSEERITPDAGLKQLDYEHHLRLANPASGAWRRKSQCD